MDWRGRDHQDGLRELHELHGEGPGHRKRRCVRCGETFYSASSLARYCSDRCRNDANVDRRRGRLDNERVKVCLHCRRDFMAARVDTLYCSAECRQAAYRARIVRKREEDAESDRIMADYSERLHRSPR